MVAAAAAAARAGTAAKGAQAAKGAKGAGAAKASRASKSGRANVSGPATKGDVAKMGAQAAAGDQLLAQAYQAGQDATPFDELVADVREAPGAREAYDSGAAERRRGRLSGVVAGGRQAASGVAGVRGPGLVNDGAGFLLGLLLYALAINYLQGGAPQARGWLAAKFLNRPYGGKVPKVPTNSTPVGKVGR